MGEGGGRGRAPAPRQGMLSLGERPELASPLDFSFCCISSIKELLRVQPRAGPLPPQPTHALRLNNNSLEALGGLPPTLEQLLVTPAQLRWLDLSFNRLTAIDPVLTTFRALRSLQLHGNSISSLAEVDKLGVLPQLRRLTLHGNPMEEQRGYRSYVLSLLPHLTSLDFSGVTKQDREDAANARLQHGKKK
ncbi:leucine-rich repeat-containing protein 51 [Chroicocephalus ridibundus]|uniref:leucine-rich repeat-containing protein 51 n=1 Tax=Chroicocephalus ridibundus TaxID=1192867 RepID=UPI002FDD867E